MQKPKKLFHAETETR